MPKRILVIEPSRTLRTLFTIYFQQAGHRVLLLSDYTTANKTIPTLKLEPPDMAFVSVYPMQMQCYQVLGHLRQLRLSAGTAIVALVGRDDSAHVQLHSTLRMIGAVTLLKPFRIQDVMALVSSPSGIDMSLAQVESRE